MQCPSCQAQFDSGKFCPVCGVAIAPAAPAADVAPAADPLVGQLFGGKYKIVKLLGEGGMGCVYKGEQMLGTKARNVAVKTLHPHLSKDAKILARFEREVGTIAELEHPNTIQVYDYGKTESDVLYIVMEFVLGQNLADTLEKSGAMEPGRVEKIMAQVCGSLEEAHGRGIVHRDLKPDNVVLTDRAGSKDFVKVLDFGIAKRSNEEDKNEQKLTQQGMVLGTPPYMSPEQFTGKPIDARSDIYSLAIMAYEMLTANLPFQADTAWEWATQHMTAPPKDIDTMPFHERIPPRMKDALRKALQKSPDERYATVGLFFAAFSGTAPAAEVPAAAPAQAVAVASAPKRGTEIGTPLDFSAAGAPIAPSAGSGYGAPPPAQAGTPAQGNVAFPTPNAGVPQGPANPRGAQAGDGGNKGMLLGIAAVVAALSIGAVGIALHGKSSAGPAVEPTFDAAVAPAVDLLTGMDAGPPPGITPSPSDSALGTLQPSGGGGGAPHSGGHSGPGKEPPGKEPPGKEPSPKPSASAVASAKPPSGPPPACAQAALMRKAGNIPAFAADERLCRQQGGTVPP